MKQYLLITVLLIASYLALGNITQETPPLIIHGEISGVRDGASIYLIRNSTKDTISRAVIKSSKFTLISKSLLDVDYYFLRFDSSITPLRSKEFIISNTSQKLSGNLEKWPAVKLSGSEANDTYNRVIKIWDHFESVITSTSTNKDSNFILMSKLQLPHDSIQYRKIEAANVEVDREVNRLIKVRTDSILTFIKENLTSLYIPDLIRRTKSSFTLNELNNLYSNLGTKVKNCYFGKLLEKDIDLDNKRLNIRKGSTIPDFNVTTIEGKKTSINELISKSKYTLIDFWASWCKPCRESVPKIKLAYNKFKRSDFNVVGIALSDKPTNWKNAIFEDGNTWTNCIDEQNVTYKIFDIPAIPGYALVDQYGKLISFSCSGSSIPEFGPTIRDTKLIETIQYLIDSTNSIKPVKPYGVGEKVPNVYLGQILNHPTLKEAHLSDFKNDLIILDFWSTWCAVCIAQFPKLKKIQDEIGERLLILPVGFDVDKEGSIKAFLNRTKGTKNELKLPTVLQKPSDSLLEKCFPFNGLPHVVWIDGNRIVKGITDHRAVTRSNIEQILNGKELNFSVKKITKGYINYNDPFLIHPVNGKRQMGIAITGFIDSLSSISLPGLQPTKDSSAWYYYGANNPIFTYYKNAYSYFFNKLNDVHNRRIVIEGAAEFPYKDWNVVSAMNNWEYSNFQDENLKSIEIRIPYSRNLSEAYKKMIYFLDSAFNIESRLDKRRMACLTLIKTSKETTLHVKEAPIKERIEPDGSSNLKNIIQIKGDNTLDYLLDQLENSMNTQNVLINKTGIKDAINMTIDIELNDLNNIREQLKKYGLDLIPGIEDFEVLVLRSKKG